MHHRSEGQIPSPAHMPKCPWGTWLKLLKNESFMKNVECPKCVIISSVLCMVISVVSDMASRLSESEKKIAELQTRLSESEKLVEQLQKQKTGTDNILQNTNSLD